MVTYSWYLRYLDRSGEQLIASSSSCINNINNTNDYHPRMDTGILTLKHHLQYHPMIFLFALFFWIVISYQFIHVYPCLTLSKRACNDSYTVLVAALVITIQDPGRHPTEHHQTLNRLAAAVETSNPRTHTFWRKTSLFKLEIPKSLGEETDCLEIQKSLVVSNRKHRFLLRPFVSLGIASLCSGQRFDFGPIFRPR